MSSILDGFDFLDHTLSPSSSSCRRLRCALWKETRSWGWLHRMTFRLLASRHQAAIFKPPPTIWAPGASFKGHRAGQGHQFKWTGSLRHMQGDIQTSSLRQLQVLQLAEHAAFGLRNKALQVFKTYVSAIRVKLLSLQRDGAIHRLSLIKRATGIYKRFWSPNNTDASISTTRSSVPVLITEQRQCFPVEVLGCNTKYLRKLQFEWENIPVLGWAAQAENPTTYPDES